MEVKIWEVHVELCTRLGNVPVARTASPDLSDEAMLKPIDHYSDALFDDDIYRRLGFDNTDGQEYFAQLNQAGLATYGMGVMNQGKMLDLTEGGRACVVQNRHLSG